MHIVDTAVLVFWLYAAALVETRFRCVVAAIAALWEGQNAYDVFANALGGCRLWRTDV